jgi:hypothetical protein
MTIDESPRRSASPEGLNQREILATWEKDQDRTFLVIADDAERLNPVLREQTEDLTTTIQTLLEKIRTTLQADFPGIDTEIQKLQFELTKAYVLKHEDREDASHHAVLAPKALLTPSSSPHTEQMLQLLKVLPLLQAFFTNVRRTIKEHEDVVVAQNNTLKRLEERLGKIAQELKDIEKERSRATGDIAQTTQLDQARERLHDEQTRSDTQRERHIASIVRHKEHIHSYEDEADRIRELLESKDYPRCAEKLTSSRVMTSANVVDVEKKCITLVTFRIQEEIEEEDRAFREKKLALQKSQRRHLTWAMSGFVTVAGVLAGIAVKPHLFPKKATNEVETSLPSEDIVSIAPDPDSIPHDTYPLLRLDDWEWELQKAVKIQQEENRNARKALKAKREMIPTLTPGNVEEAQQFSEEMQKLINVSTRNILELVERNIKVRLRPEVKEFGEGINARKLEMYDFELIFIDPRTGEESNLLENEELMTLLFPSKGELASFMLHVLHDVPNYPSVSLNIGIDAEHNAQPQTVDSVVATASHSAGRTYISYKEGETHSVGIVIPIEVMPPKTLQGKLQAALADSSNYRVFLGSSTNAYQPRFLGQSGEKLTVEITLPEEVQKAITRSGVTFPTNNLSADKSTLQIEVAVRGGNRMQALQMVPSIIVREKDGSSFFVTTSPLLSTMDIDTDVNEFDVLR